MFKVGDTVKLVNEYSYGCGHGLEVGHIAKVASTDGDASFEIEHSGWHHKPESWVLVKSKEETTMKKPQRVEILKKIKQATKDFEVANDYKRELIVPEIDNKAPDDSVKELASILDELGEAGDRLRPVFSELAGKKIPKKKRTKTTGKWSPFVDRSDDSSTVKTLYELYACIVPMASHNSHTYEIGVPVVCVDKGEQYFMVGGGSVRNHMAKEIRDMRPATDEEIESLSDSYLESLRSMLKD